MRRGSLPPLNFEQNKENRSTLVANRKRSIDKRSLSEQVKHQKGKFKKKNNKDYFMKKRSIIQFDEISAILNETRFSNFDDLRKGKDNGAGRSSLDETIVGNKENAAAAASIETI
jgi:hypothetical protein